MGSIPTRSRHPPPALTTTLLLVNPAAGRGRAGRLKDRALTACRSAWSDVTLMETTAPGDGVDRARHAAEAGVELVLVLGGDGAVHEAANGILTARTTPLPALGVLPVGTGNDYAKLTGTTGLGIEQAASRLRSGRVRTLDVGRIASEYFVNSAGVGFDAEVARRVNGMRLRGPPAYLLAVAQAYGSFKPLRIRLVTAREGVEEVVLVIEVGIGGVVGGGFRINPGASPDDGLFDVCLVRSLSLFEFLTRLPLVMLGWHTRLRQVRCFKTDRLTIESLDGPLLAHLDGEVRTLGSRLEVTIEPARLPVLFA
ncbi:MAG TPA: diacylglycerol kinase family protein [Gemmatimonadales bacterium]|nr:diacylglycerol kinase family protein [Gemmatimonadales bacterium]